VINTCRPPGLSRFIPQHDDEVDFHVRIGLKITYRNSQVYNSVCDFFQPRLRNKIRKKSGMSESDRLAPPAEAQDNTF
jgi:hypothetical protein